MWERHHTESLWERHRVWSGKGRAADWGIGSWCSKGCPPVLEAPSTLGPNLGTQRLTVEDKSSGLRLPVCES